MTIEELIETGQSFRGQPDQYSELITELADALEAATNRTEVIGADVERPSKTLKMKLSEYVRQVLNDPKYGGDIEWVKINLHHNHVEQIESQHVTAMQVQALRDAADWVEELAVHDGLMYKGDGIEEYEAFSIPDALRDRADYLEKNS